jgi:dCMP deaminase
MTQTQNTTPGGPDWDRRFIELAQHIAQWSKDPSTKVGCVVVGPDREIRSTGFNGFPRGISDDLDRLADRAQKYPIICHAEENAVMHAARIGMALKGCIAYVSFPVCVRCARGMIQAGIREVVYPADIAVPEAWAVDGVAARALFAEAGVCVRMIDSPLNILEQLRRGKF